MRLPILLAIIIFFCFNLNAQNNINSIYFAKHFIKIKYSPFCKYSALQMDDTLLNYVKKIELEKTNAMSIDLYISLLVKSCIKKKKVKEIEKKFGKTNTIPIDSLLDILTYPFFHPKYMKEGDLLYNPNSEQLPKENLSPGLLNDNYWKEFIALKVSTILECFYGYKNIMPNKTLFTDSSIITLIKSIQLAGKISEINNILVNYLCQLGDPHLHFFGNLSHQNMKQVPGLFIINNLDTVFYYDRFSNSCKMVTKVNNIPVREYIENKLLRYKFYRPDIATRELMFELKYSEDSNIELTCRINGVDVIDTIHLLTEGKKVGVVNENKSVNAQDFKELSIEDSILIIKMKEKPDLKLYKQMFDLKPTKYNSILLLWGSYDFKNFSLFNRDFKSYTSKEVISVPWSIHKDTSLKITLKKVSKFNPSIPNVPLFIYFNRLVQSAYEYNYLHIKEVNKNVKFIGTTTAGAAGEILDLKLYPGFFCRFTTTQITIMGIDNFMYKGIKPDIFVNTEINNCDINYKSLLKAKIKEYLNEKQFK